MRFRLLECKRCGERTWVREGMDPLLRAQGDHWHEWWERFTFHAEDNGPGLAPDQTDAEVHVAHLPQLLGDAFGISRSEARRCIAQGGVRIGDQVITEPDVPVGDIDGKELRLGKRRSKTIRFAGVQS